MSTKKYVCVLAGAAVVVAAVVVGILGCEQNAKQQAGVKPPAGRHTEGPTATPKPRHTGSMPAGRHTEGHTTPTPPPQ